MDIMGTLDTGFTIILVIVALGCLFALGAFIFHLTRYKHKFRIKKITGTKTIVLDDKAKQFKDNNGVTWWKLLKAKHVISVPPADCLDVTDKGRYSVEAYYSDESGYQFEENIQAGDMKPLKDKGVSFKIPLIKKTFTLFNIAVETKDYFDNKKGKYVYIEDKRPSVKGTDVLSTKQKVIMVNQLEKAKARKGLSWREHIPLIVGATALVFMIAVVFIFFDNIVKPLEPMVTKFNDVAVAQQETTRMLQEMIQKKQIIPEGMRDGSSLVQGNGTVIPG